MPPSDDGRLTIQPITPLRQRLIIYGYIGFFALAWPFARIWSTKAAFVLKDDLHMPAAAIANFYLLVDVPAYLGFAFGLMRDRWNLFGRRDQGLLNVFCGLVTVLTFAAAALPASYAALVGVLLCSAVFGQLIGAGFQGLTSLLGQEHVMSGRIASVWQATAGVPLMVVAIIAGKVATHCTMSQAFLIGGCISLAVTLFTLWRPPEVYDEAENAPVGRHSFVRDVKVLLRTRELYPVVLLMFLWNFTPGVGTPIQFYLTDTLHGTAENYGNFNALFNGCFIPTFLLYGYLCTRVRIRPLVWACTIIAVPQIMPLLIVHSVPSAMVAAIPMGLMGGLATAAYVDLLIRACPPGLQGTAMMLGSSAWALSGELGNVAGARMYDYYHNFAPCAWATFIVYALMLPVIPFLSQRLTRNRDGEVLPASSAD